MNGGFDSSGSSSNNNSNSYSTSDLVLFNTFIGLMNYGKNLEQVQRGRRTEEKIKKILSLLEGNSGRSDDFGHAGTHEGYDF